MALTFSNSHLWANCAQSCSAAPAPDFIPERDTSDAAAEGIAAHWVINALVHGDATNGVELVGKCAPNGHEIDAAMARHAQAYVDLLRKHGPIAPERSHTLWGGLVNGKPDPHSSADNDECLRVHEFKYGWRLVEPKGNPQLILAAIANMRPHHKLFSLEVFQPRPYHPDGPHRRAVLNISEMAQHAERLRLRATEIMGGADVAQVGAAWCGDCHRRGRCVALTQALALGFDMVNSRLQGHSRAPEDLGREASMLRTLAKLLKAKQSAVEGEMMARLKKGGNIPGWELTPGNSSREITAPAEEVEMLTGVDPWEPRRLKSPKALEDEGVDPALVALLQTVTPGKMRLEPFTAAKAERAFNELGKRK